MSTNISIPVVPFVLQQYFDYGQEVIESRALPDIRDGLKPVQRRILYAMKELGCTYNASFMKSARIVGQVMGKYHPHGDSAIYEAMVKKAQYFKENALLIKPQGNFGSIDGDGAAAMRYTEAKLSDLGTNSLFNDMDKNIVDFVDNYDGTSQEPSVLPVSFPQLWVNGCSGIAVGVAIALPCHNLRETIDVVLAYQKNPNITIDEIIEIMPAPDFPTGAYVYNLQGYKKALETGNGSIKMRCKYTIEDNNDRSRKYKKILVLQEIPYGVNKTALIDELKSLVEKDKNLSKWVFSIKDESSKNDIRIAIYLMDEGNEQGDLIFNIMSKKLSRYMTPSVHYNINVINHNGSGYQQVGFIEIVKEFLQFRKEILVRKTNFELNKAEKEKHLLYGLIAVLEYKNGIDEAIKIIKQSQTSKIANQSLQNFFKIDELQAQEILKMQLQKLTGAELDSIKQQYQNLIDLIQEKQEILASDSKQQKIIRKDLMDFKKRFADLPEFDRKTQILDESMIQNATIEPEIIENNEKYTLFVTKDGYVKKLDENTKQKLEKTDKPLIILEGDDIILQQFESLGGESVFFFDESGYVFETAVHCLPDMEKGRHLKNIFSNFNGKLLGTVTESTEFVVMVTAQGRVKCSKPATYKSNRKNGMIAYKIDDKNTLTSVLPAKSGQNLFCATNREREYTFKVDELPMFDNKTAFGNYAFRLRKNEYINGIMIR